MGAIVTRSDDVRLLDWLRRRTAGETSDQIGARYGETSARVRVATNRVLEADLKLSGEDPGQVRASYWRS